MIGALISGTFYRLHSPQWAHLATSGAGSAKHGGRVNRPGTEALYLAADLKTALAELQQGSPVLPPRNALLQRNPIRSPVSGLNPL
jgi:RES domain-containing protein